MEHLLVRAYHNTLACEKVIISKAVKLHSLLDVLIGKAEHGAQLELKGVLVLTVKAYEIQRPLLGISLRLRLGFGFGFCCRLGLRRGLPEGPYGGAGGGDAYAACQRIRKVVVPCAAAEQQRAERKQHYPPHAQGSSSAGTRMPVSMLEYSQRYQLSPFCLSLMGRAASAPAVFKNSRMYPSSQSWGRWSG